MSSIRVLRVECRCPSPSTNHTSVPSSSIIDTQQHTITTMDVSELNSNNEKLPLKNPQIQITHEFKTNTFKRKIEVKTTQEDTVCQTDKPSPTMVSSTAAYLKHTRIHQSPKSSVSNNSSQNVRASISSSASTNQTNPKLARQVSTHSSMVTNFLQENLDERIKSNEKTGEKHYRPLLDYAIQLNQRNLATQLQYVSDLDDRRTTLLPSRLCILPPKPLPSFAPVIVTRKYQEPINCFDFISQNDDSLSPSLNSSFTRSSSHSGVISRQTMTMSTDIGSNSNKNSSNDTTTCQLTSGVESSNQSNELSGVNGEYNASLSTNVNDLTGTSNVNAISTSNGSIDDKNGAKRKAIAMQMYDTEKSYVEALKNLVTKYYLPMKDKDVVSSDLLNDIFYKVPEIHIHHTAFMLSLSQKFDEWDNKQTVGDLLLHMFTRTSVIETYTSFVNNYETAQMAIRLCREFSSFNKFLEQQARDHHGKLTLRDLIIQPVQRIPRYELYIKDFLKCTNLNHPDYPLLLKAQSEIHSLAEQIDQMQKEVGSTEFNATNNSLEVVQDMIENLTDLVDGGRYYIRHDVVTLQLSSGLESGRWIFLFNDLIIITDCKRKNANLTRKPTNFIVVNSPSGKQYINNNKHKLIKKISLESVDLATDHLNKTKSSISTSSSLTKSDSTTNATINQRRHLVEGTVVPGRMTDLVKTVSQLDNSIKETLYTVTKNIVDEIVPTVNNQKTNSESFRNSDNTQQKSNTTQLIINTTERTETIDVLFTSSEQKLAWEKEFLEAKRILFETAIERRNIKFQHVLTLQHNRPGSQYLCGILCPSSGDLCLCSTQGEVCLLNVESHITIKSYNTISSFGINCIGYIPSNKTKKLTNTTKQNGQQYKHSVVSKQQSTNSQRRTTINLLFDIDSSDDDDINQEDNLSSNNSSINTVEDSLNSEQYDTRQATIWLGTPNGGLFIYQCLHTMEKLERKNQIFKQLNSSIHAILHTDNKVFLALNYGQLCVFKRDINGHWDFNSPIIQTIGENSTEYNHENVELNNDAYTDPISVIILVAGRLWCALRDRVFVVCPNTLNVEHSFIVDDCHRHVCCITAGGSSMQHVWIASKGSYDIRLYHATHFICVLETSIRATVAQKLQVCDHIIRAHKLGCLHVSALYAYKETLWIGTSAGIIINLAISQLIDSFSTTGINKLTSNSIHLKTLPYGHAGPVRSIVSIDKNIVSSKDEATIAKTFIITIGDGFEDYNNNNKSGENDALSHLILWEL